MRPGLDYLGEVVDKALGSLLCWGIILFGVVFAASWFGISISERRIAGVEAGFAPMVMACVTAVMYYPSAVALGVAISAWYLPVRFESPLLALVLAIIALFVWTTIAALCPVLHELPF